MVTWLRPGGEGCGGTVCLGDEGRICGIGFEGLERLSVFGGWGRNLPLTNSAPWGKLSSWLCSASQEYMALASLKKTNEYSQVKNAII